MPKDLNIKVLIEETLVQSGYSDKRSRKMAIEDFLGLLLAFNKAGIHFHA